MKTLNTTTLHQTQAGNFYIEHNEITYCFGDCKEWADRFYNELINREVVIEESEVAQVVHSEAWGFRVHEKNTPNSYQAWDLNQAFEIFNRINRISGVLNALDNAPTSILRAIDTNAIIVNL